MKLYMLQKCCKKFECMLKNVASPLPPPPPAVLCHACLPACSGPASGSGFNDLAGYIFGGNESKLSMQMTTPGVHTCMRP